MGNSFAWTDSRLSHMASKSSSHYLRSHFFSLALLYCNVCPSGLWQTGTCYVLAYHHSVKSHLAACVDRVLLRDHREGTDDDPLG